MIEYEHQYFELAIRIYKWRKDEGEKPKAENSFLDGRQKNGTAKERSSETRVVCGRKERIVVSLG